VMESLGKEKDLDNHIVNQGISVFGNKGSTDQHSYIQQLRDGPNDFFVSFIEVLKDERKAAAMVEPQATAGDFLHGFYLGTRQALAEKSRESLTITVKEVSPFSVGVLIALFERAVGLYASLININAYHQPGVEAGKKTAGNVIEIQNLILNFLTGQPKQRLSIEEIANGIKRDQEIESVFKICEHLSANPDRRIEKFCGASPFSAKYAFYNG